MAELHPSWKEQAEKDFHLNDFWADQLEHYGSKQFVEGAAAFQAKALEELEKNYQLICQDQPLSEFDEHRMRAVRETYEDFINMIKNLPSHGTTTGTTTTEVEVTSREETSEDRG